MLFIMSRGAFSVFVFLYLPEFFLYVVGVLGPMGHCSVSLSVESAFCRPFFSSDFNGVWVSVPMFPSFCSGLLLGVFGVPWVGLLGWCFRWCSGESRLPRYPPWRLRRTQPATDGGEGSVKVLVFRDSGWFARGARARKALVRRASTLVVQIAVVVSPIPGPTPVN